MGQVLEPRDRLATLTRIVAAARDAATFVQVGGELMTGWNETGMLSWAEAIDLRTLVQLKVDGLSLSEETAVGRDPVGAVVLLDRLVQAWEIEDRTRELAPPVST